MRRPKFRFSIRGFMLAVAALAVLGVWVVAPAWKYYRLDPPTRRALTLLKRPMTVGGDAGGRSPLTSLLKQIRATTTDPATQGLPIYLDPLGLQEAKADPSAEVAVAAGRSSVSQHLARALPGIGLGYYVKDGMLYITSAKSARIAVENLPGAAVP